MSYLRRSKTAEFIDILERGKSILLLGPRQTGKSTLIDHLEFDRSITLADPRQRLRYEQNPGILIDEIGAMDASKPTPRISIDEIQKVPALLDAVQYLTDKKLAIFFLTGSSARKLKQDGEVNLLPGRVIYQRFDALSIAEFSNNMPALDDLLMYGSLPEIITTDNPVHKEELLESYVITYLEEEVRKEALVRNLGSFSRFLELAASESGYTVNMSKLSSVIGIQNQTIQSYYQILEDCLIVERIEPLSESKTRHRLTKTQKYLFYDLGVKRLAAREGINPPNKYKGHLFEHFIGLELIKIARLQKQRTRIRYWQDKNGPKVDWLIDSVDEYIPIEVKLTDAPNAHDARHLKLFLSEYDKANKAFIVCTTPHKMQLAENIIAVNWEDLSECFN